VSRFHPAEKNLPIRQGSVYWLRDCPPLDDDNTKDRPVVVVDDPKSLADGGPVIVVACTTKNRESEEDAVKLSDRSTMPQARSGLAKPCWGIPRWDFPIERERLTEYKGHLTGNVLKRLLIAYTARATQ
jgi:mRNA-degrading endonuclease toxin of MazEF toxin-antitoxin module